MRRCLQHTGFDGVYSQSERQYASLGRIVGYIKSRLGLKILRALRLENATVPMIVPGTIFSIWRKRAAGCDACRTMHRGRVIYELRWYFAATHRVEGRL